MIKITETTISILCKICLAITWILAIYMASILILDLPVVGMDITFEELDQFISVIAKPVLYKILIPIWIGIILECIALYAYYKSENYKNKENDKDER